jgi:hypothetical protein
METGVVSSGNFIKHDVSGGRNTVEVLDILVHPGQDKPVIIIADNQNNELRTYDLTSWQCVSQCTTPDMPMCLYESDGDVYLHCWDGSLYNILSVRPLTITTSPHGHVTGKEYYYCISHLGSGRLVAISPEPLSAVHVIDLHGRQFTDLTTCGGYSFTGPCGVVCDGRRVVVTGRGEGSCLGREWANRDRVVCLEESAGTWSVQWMHDVDVVDVILRTPIIIAPGGGTVIVPCYWYPDRIVRLSLETGAVVQRVHVAPGCPDLGMGTCVYGGSLLVGCGETGVVVEFSILGMMVSPCCC